MRASEGAVRHDGPDLGHVERHAEGAELLDHRLAARVALLAEYRQTGLELGLFRIEKEAEDVDVVAVAARRELARGHGHEARALRRGLELGQAVNGVVIREREHGEAGLDAAGHELRRRLEAVRERRVAVQVGAAERGIRAW